MNYRQNRYQRRATRNRHVPPAQKPSASKKFIFGVSVLALSTSAVIYPISAHANWLTAIYEQMRQNIFGASFNIHSKQVAANSSGIVSTNLATGQSVIGTLQSVDQSLKVKDYLLDTQVKGAIPSSAGCISLAERESSDLQNRIKNLALSGELRDDAAFISTSKTDQDNSALVIHLETACSAGEAAKGICTLRPDGTQSMDVDYSTFGLKNQITPAELRVSMNYTNFLGGFSLPEEYLKCDAGDVGCVHAQNRNAENQTFSSLTSHVVKNQLLSKVRFDNEDVVNQVVKK